MAHRLTGLMAALVLTACQTPGLAFDAAMPAGHPEASAYRHVAVEPFGGSEGAWYSQQFEAMLARAYFDGRPWFELTAPYARDTGLTGIYSGRVDVDWVDVDEDVRTERRCVEWDGLFDCERRADVDVLCLDVRVSVSADVQLHDAASGALVFTRRYVGTASDSDCDEDGYAYGDGTTVRYDGRYYDGRAGRLVDRLVHEALLDTLPDIRRDIAPRNAIVRAPLIAEAVEPEAGADPRFAEAVAAAGNGQMGRACLLWSELRDSYRDAPGVAHNAGVCAEAAGDLDTAEALYAEAGEAMAFYPRAERSAAQIQRALQRLAERRSGNALLDQLTAPPEPVLPEPGGDPEG